MQYYQRFVKLSCLRCIFGVTSLMVLAPHLHASPVVANDVKSRFEEHLVAVSNVMCQYTFSTDHTPPPWFLERNPNVVAYQDELDETMSLLNGNLIWTHSPSPSYVKQLVAKGSDYVKQYNIYTQDRVECLSKHATVAAYLGQIQDSMRLPFTLMVDQALGIRRYDGDTWLSREEVSNATVDGPSSGEAARICFHDGKGYQDEWYIQGDTGCTIIKYELVDSLGRTVISLDFSGFRTISGVSVPTIVHGERTSYLKINGNGPTRPFVIEKYFVDIKEISINSADNKPGNYQMVWPLHAVVRDGRTGEMFVITSGPRKLSDSDIYHLLKHREDAATTNPTTEATK